jgi:hypothetical protein
MVPPKSVNHSPFASVSFAFLSLSLVGLLGCSSSGSSPDGGASGPTWTDVYSTVMTTGSITCVDHHSGGVNAAGNLDMSTQKLAYANLVNVPAMGPSCGVAALDGGTPEIRVVPGSATASLLYQKLVGTQTCGAQMPDLGDAIPASQLALVKSWIDNGAANN